MKEVNTREVFTNALSYFKDSDDGKTGKAFEIAIREYIQPESKRNGRVSPQYTNYGDLYRWDKKEGKRRMVKIEVKSACGELAKTDSIDLTKVFPGKDFIIYCPEVDPAIPMEKQSFVFSRERFIQMLVSYPGRGSLLRVKEVSPAAAEREGEKTESDYRISFQSFRSASRPKASQAIAAYIWDCCYDCPTVEEWLANE